jgi:hypothetical protein
LAEACLGKHTVHAVLYPRIVGKGVEPEGVVDTKRVGMGIAEDVDRVALGRQDAQRVRPCVPPRRVLIPAVTELPAAIPPYRGP